MKNLFPLMQREWLQHRLGWALMALLPLAFVLVMSAVGNINIDDDSRAKMGEAALPEIIATLAIVCSTAVIFIVVWFSSLIIACGLARRDHADRSIEFWLSLPVSHSRSLATPLLVHLLLAPAAAVIVGLVGGWVISFVLVARAAGVGAWFDLPWGQLVAASLAVAARLLAGLPLATLWLAPLILLVMLMTAWFRRWGWVVLVVGMGLGGVLLKQLFGQPLISDLMSQFVRHALRSLVAEGQGGFVVHSQGDLVGALAVLPAWALNDFGIALRELASPLLAGGLLFAAACFALIVQWRSRGAAAAG